MTSAWRGPISNCEARGTGSRAKVARLGGGLALLGGAGVVALACDVAATFHRVVGVAVGVLAPDRLDFMLGGGRGLIGLGAMLPGFGRAGGALPALIDLLEVATSGEAHRKDQ